MLINRFHLTLAIAALMPLLTWAQVPQRPPTPGNPANPATAKDEPPTEAEKLLDEAIDKVRALKSVEADLLQTVFMLGQDFQVKGKYLRGPGYQIRFELNLANLADVDGTMLQICDGKTCWDYQKIANSQSYIRLDIDKILKRLESPEFDATLKERAIAQIGFTGPEALLVGLRKAVLFDQKDEEILDGKKVWVIRGFWKDRASLSAPGQAPLSGPLPPYVPSVVALSIGQDDGWPYRLEMKGRIRPTMTEKKGAPAKSTPVKRQDQPSSVVLVYSNVKLNAEVDPSRFFFQAPDPRIVPGSAVFDRTENFLVELEKAAQMSLQQKKAEAAKSGDIGNDGVLPQPIEIPKTAPDPIPIPPRPPAAAPNSR